MRYEPVGAPEIAQRLTALGAPVEHRTVNQWEHRRKQWEKDGRPARRARDEPMPAPVGTVSGYPAWDWPEVLAWARRTGRLVPDHARRSGEAAS